MSKNEEYVDFVARDGVTLYPGRSVAGHAAGSAVKLPKSHADSFDHLRAQPTPAPQSESEAESEDQA